MKQDFCVVGPGGRMVARGELQVEGSRASAHIRFDPIAPRDAWAIDLDASAQARRDVVLTRIRKQTSRVLRMRLVKRFFRNSLAVAPGPGRDLGGRGRRLRGARLGLRVPPVSTTADTIALTPVASVRTPDAREVVRDILPVLRGQRMRELARSSEPGARAAIRDLDQAIGRCEAAVRTRG